ncbi:MAG TPA: MXAN_6640 family putative metalloprotease [Nocardioides sp.]
MIGRATVGLALAAALVVPLQSVADEPTPTPGPATPGAAASDPAAVALEALETAEDLLAGTPATGTPGLVPDPSTDTESQSDPTTDVTLALLDVRQSLGDLPASEKDRARRLLSRPSSPGPTDTVSYPVGADRAHCSEHFCVHWAASGHHRPDLTDENVNGVPDQVERVAQEAEVVWTKEIDGLGFLPPLSDGTRGNLAPEDRSGLIDVYLGDTGAQGIYGYAETEGWGSRLSGFLVIDDDFEDFATPPLDSMKVTLAHEFLHLSQFSTDVTEDQWLMEGTATWIEEQIHDDINDNRQYLSMCSLRVQQMPLDHPDGWYGNWIFFEHLTKSYGAGIVQEIWHEARSTRVYSFQAIQAALAKHGSCLADDLSRFAGSNTIPAKFYPEGRNYPSARTAGAWTLAWSRPTTGTVRTRIPQLASKSYSIAPHAALSSKWRLRVTIDAPSYSTRAYLVLHRPGSVTQRKPIRLNSSGNASFSVPFHRGSVTKVSVSLSNTSRRFTCDRDTARSCEGVPRDSNRLFRLRATATS